MLFLYKRISLFGNPSWCVRNDLHEIIGDKRSIWSYYEFDYFLIPNPETFSLVYEAVFVTGGEKTA